MSQGDNLSVASVTGANIELRVAGPGGRAYAFIIDWHIRAILAVIWLMSASLLLAGSGDSDGSSSSDISRFFLVGLPAGIIYFLYHPILEVLMHGTTPGKRFAGVRIVDRQGGVPSAGALLTRNVFRLIDCLPVFYVVGLITTIFSVQSVRFGDLAAGTILVYEADRKSDVFDDIQKLGNSNLAPEVAELTADVLARWKELDENSRLTIGRKILRSAGLDDTLDKPADLQRALTRLIA